MVFLRVSIRKLWGQANDVLHLTAFPLRSRAAGELGRYTLFQLEINKPRLDASSLFVLLKPDKIQGNHIYLSVSELQLQG
jgi:hypothetical protein